MKTKKLFALILAMVLIFTLAACGEKETSDDPNTLTIGPYTATYKGSEIAVDSEGDDAIIMNFNYHNGGEEEESFEWSYFYTVMQGGVEMEYAVVFVSEDSYDTLDESTRLAVAPGGNIDVSLTYKLQDMTSPIEIKVSDLFEEEQDSITIDPASATRRADTSSADTENSSLSEPTGADSMVGFWELYCIDSDDSSNITDPETVELMKSMGIYMYIELRADGTGTFMIDEPVEITWGDGYVSSDGEDIACNIVDGELVLDSTDVIFRFVPGDGSAGDVSAGAMSDYENFWLGDWYGWWTIIDGDGYYTDYVGNYYDCCAFIEPYDDDYLLSIWDTDFNDYKSDCLSEVFIDLTSSYFGGNSAAVTIDNEDNYFWAGAVSEGEWYLDPAVLNSETMVAFTSEYTDADGDTLEYYVVLCKWGYEWDTNIIDAPYYYDSFFMPLMEDGGELPVVFEPEA